MTKRNREKDQALLVFVQEYMMEHGYSPTVREITVGLGGKATSAIYVRMLRLHNEGHLTWEPNRPRTLRLTVPEGTAKE